MLKKYFLLIAIVYPSLLVAQDNNGIKFTDVWTAFNMKTAHIDSFMRSKGYTPDRKIPNQWIYMNTSSRLSATITFTYFDSSRISGLSFEQKNESAGKAVNELAANQFVLKDSSGVPAKKSYTNREILEFESAHYMLFCSVFTAYPRKEICQVNYGWHDLITQSLVVVKKGSNPYLSPELVAEFEQTSFPTIFKSDESSSFKMLTENAKFKGGRRGMYIYMNDNVHYPEAAIKDSIEAIITVQFNVDKKGKVQNAEVIKGKEAGHGIPEEAIRLVNAMPLWKPSLELNRIVETTIRQKLIFKIRLNNLL